MKLVNLANDLMEAAEGFRVAVNDHVETPVLELSAETTLTMQARLFDVLTGINNALAVLDESIEAQQRRSRADERRNESTRPRQAPMTPNKAHANRRGGR